MTYLNRTQVKASTPHQVSKGALSVLEQHVDTMVAKAMERATRATDDVDGRRITAGTMAWVLRDEFK